MKLKYYGTSAAEGIPGLFCDCDNCRYARENGGRNIRTRSQAIINDKILIDLPPDTLYHVQRMGLELYNIKHLFITHAHSDHLLASDLLEKQNGHAHTTVDEPITIYGSMPSIDRIFSVIHRKVHVNSGKWILQEIQPFSEISADGVCVIPYKASHAYELNSFIYDVCDGKKRMLYAHDTGIFPHETMSFIESNKPFFNLISLDCTAGLLKDWRDTHMGLDTCIEMRDKLISLGCADKSTIFVLNHFSHNGSCSYDSIVPIAEKEGFLVSYDGLEIEF